jgi:sterol desaturase/sphingolipid hydroxylase (fatty acid hydroxylase superfamily)
LDSVDLAGDREQGGIGSLTMTEAAADSLLIYGFTAMMAHLLMSLGQTLFHRYLGHSRLGGRFFKNHVQFHHVHYAGDHVVSTSYLDNGDNNTLFFLIPIVLVVGLSYLFLRLDLVVVQFVVMSLSFCGHYYLDNQYHVEGSWLGRFSWFRRKQQLHFVHHRHGNCNFAVIDFFWDRLLGTYRRSSSLGTNLKACSNFSSMAVQYDLARERSIANDACRPYTRGPPPRQRFLIGGCGCQRGMVPCPMNDRDGA